MEWWHYLIAIVGGALAGVINTLAGNGSAITLTILTEVLGLPGNMANGTNRVGIFFQTAAGALAFQKNKKLNVSRSGKYIYWTTVGAIAGVAVAVWVSNEQFRSVFRFLMIFMLIVILVKPKRWLQPTDFDRKLPLVLSIPMFLALGFYGGFIQMGMGVFFLAAMVLVARYEIIEANAVKLVVVGIYTLLAIAIFHWRGFIDWKIGFIMALGQTAGGWFTAMYASRHPKANIWAYRLLVLVVIIAIIKLFDLHTHILSLFS